MLRILVVDDEAIVLESITQVLKSNFDGIAIETAKNSREGLIKVEHFRPNIIMTDIRMPGMNGIEFVERIRKVDQTVKIVIVSAHDHFEYAKEAVKFDVEEYILKPLSKNKLIEVIASIAKKIVFEEELRNKEIDDIDKYYQSIQLIESNFFNSILLNRNILKFMTHYREMLEVPFQEGTIITIEFDKLSSGAESNELSNYNQKLYNCGDYLKTHIKYQKKSIVSNTFLNRIFVYVEGDVDRIFWNNLAHSIMERFKIRVRIGLGTVKSIEDIAQSYTESILTLRLLGGVVCSMHDIENTNTSYETFEAIKMELLDDFRYRNKSFEVKLKHFEGEYIKLANSKSDLEYAESVLAELLVIMHETSNRKRIQNKSDALNKHYLSELFTQSGLAKLQYFKKLVSEWFAVYTKMQSESFNDITFGALEKLKNNYNREISLEEVAAYLNVTPQYLSKLFKEDTGSTFKEYLTELRIEESKSLLKMGVLNIKDICFKVGYNDTSYFIRAFKKYEGLTPKDYQKMNR